MNARAAGSPLAAALFLAVIAGCGSTTGNAAPATPSTPRPPPATRLEITVSGQAPHIVGCPGDRICPRLAGTRVKDFAAVPRKLQCAAVYGGDAQAIVDGTLRGQDLHAQFSLSNGCEIARWKKFTWLLGYPPGIPRSG